MKKETKYEMITKYKIFEIREGLLKEPEDHYYGRSEITFDEYKSYELAEQAIFKNIEGCSSSYVILAITDKTIKWDD